MQLPWGPEQLKFLKSLLGHKHKHAKKNMRALEGETPRERAFFLNQVFRRHKLPYRIVDGFGGSATIKTLPQTQ